MKSSYLTWLILAALPVFSDQQHAAGGTSLQGEERPGLQASEKEPAAFSLFDKNKKGFHEEEKENADEFDDDEDKDEMVSSKTTYIPKRFCAALCDAPT
jgi:hypothetical protein